MTPEEMFALVNGQLNTALKGVSITGAVNQAVASGVKDGSIPILTEAQAKQKNFLTDLTTGGIAGRGGFLDNDVGHVVEGGITFGAKTANSVVKAIPFVGAIWNAGGSIVEDISGYNPTNPDQMAAKSAVENAKTTAGWNLGGAPDAKIAAANAKILGGKSTVAGASAGPASSGAQIGPTLSGPSGPGFAPKRRSFDWVEAFGY